MEKKQIGAKISKICQNVNWIETIRIDETVRDEVRKDLKRKRRSYDKHLNISENKVKKGGEIEMDLEENRKIWKDFIVSVKFILKFSWFLKERYSINW